MLQRAVHGAHDALLKDLRFTEEQDYNNYLRMAAEDFEEILETIKPDITKHDVLFS